MVCQKAKTTICQKSLTAPASSPPKFTDKMAWHHPFRQFLPNLCQIFSGTRGESIKNIRRFQSIFVQKFLFFVQRHPVSVQKPANYSRYFFERSKQSVCYSLLLYKHFSLHSFFGSASTSLKRPATASPRNERLLKIEPNS